ncbi:MAG: hypothetical protein HKN73_12945 [Gemmatimonadetes bacterium]|nr:hypothetical protein [Gemmatimonadota bacterium]
MRTASGVMTYTVLLGLALVCPSGTQAQSYEEEHGTLPDGTIYRMRVPANWNGTLLRDLDYAGRPDNPVNSYLLSRGYGMSGIQRHELRAFRYDPAREIANLDDVLDRFEQRWRTPDQVIQYGCSGGGHVTIAVAEDFSDRIDGAVALGAHTPVWLMNTFLDGWFAMKALIAPELPVVDLPFTASGGSAHGVEGDIPDAWRDAVDAAQETPEGRARMMLATTLGQWPVWSTRMVPKPDLEDVAALQHSVFHNVRDRYSYNPGGEARIMFESAADGQQLSWNTDIDYRELFENGNEYYRAAVRGLYAEAGLDLDADLDRVNAMARVEASPYALDFWNAPGRNHRGRPTIPLLRMHEIGDFQVPMAIVAGYEDLIRENGAESLFRTAFVDAPTHCGFNPAEVGAAIETMMHRLDTGSWAETTPEAMNARGAAQDTRATTRFIDHHAYMPRSYNRTWRPR